MVDMPCHHSKWYYIHKALSFPEGKDVHVSLQRNIATKDKKSKRFSFKKKKQRERNPVKKRVGKIKEKEPLSNYKDM